MKLAVAALVCVLRVAAPASAAEAVRPTTIAAQGPAIAQTVEASKSSDKSDAAKPGIEPPAVTTRIRNDSPPAHDAKPRTDGARRDGQHARVCFGAAETRETVAAHRLSEPIHALRVGRQQGEALRAKLCRTKQDEFVYEIYVLRRDGRIVRLYMDAQNGQAVGSLDDAGHR